jgi:hypothetical protein
MFPSQPCERVEPSTGSVSELPSSDAAIFELEHRSELLRTELAGLEERLRQLRIAADLCPLCGGVGRRPVRGGLYGEVCHRLCVCQGG